MTATPVILTTKQSVLYQHHNESDDAFANRVAMEMAILDAMLHKVLGFQTEQLETGKHKTTIDYDEYGGIFPRRREK